MSTYLTREEFLHYCVTELGYSFCQADAWWTRHCNSAASTVDDEGTMRCRVQMGVYFSDREWGPYFIH